MANTEQVPQNSLTKQVIEDYKKNELTPKREAARAELKAAQTKANSSASNRQYKICAYVEGQNVLNFYNTLDFCEAIATVNASAQVADKIKKVETKNGDLKKQFDDVVKSIKDLRTKLYDVEMKAYEMGDAFEDPSNKDQITALNNIIKKEDVEKLMQMSDKVHDQSNLAFSTAVDVAGILTFANVESLKVFGDDLSKKTTDFKKNVDDTVKKSTEDLKKAQQELSDASKALMLDKLSAKDPSVEITAWGETEDFLGDGDNSKCDCLQSIKDVNTVLREIGTNYEDVGGVTLDTNTPDPPKKGGHKNFDPNR
jgi:hypothetical protein